MIPTARAQGPRRETGETSDKLVCAVESETCATGGTEEVVLSFELWVLNYLSRARAKETRGTKETRQTRETT
jgi:hypothetical protein